MKITLTRLDFRNDEAYKRGLLDEQHARPYIVQYKKHWWNKQKYVIDEQTNCPRLFYSREEALVCARDMVM